MIQPIIVALFTFRRTLIVERRLGKVVRTIFTITLEKKGGFCYDSNNRNLQFTSFKDAIFIE